MRVLHQITEAVIGFNRWLILALEDGRIEEWQDDASEYNLISFSQTWGSTSLGFGGVGGQALTSAQTTIFTDDFHAVVFIGGAFAYSVKEPVKQFWLDVSNHRIADVATASRYQKKDK